MNSQTNKRRRFIKASLAVPLLGHLPFNSSIASAMTGSGFQVPDNIHHVLTKLYGSQADFIDNTSMLKLKAPAIAENGAVVTVAVTGEKNLVSSVAIFVAKNKDPFASTFTLYEGTDLAVSLRIKVEKTSDIYVIGQSDAGLIGVRKEVKITIGCGGV